MATLAQLNAVLASKFDHYEISADPVTLSGNLTWENAGAESVAYYRVRGVELRDDHTFKTHILEAVKFNDGASDTWFLSQQPDDSAEAESALFDWCETTFDKVFSFQYNKQTRSASVLAYVVASSSVKAFVAAEYNSGFVSTEVDAQVYRELV